MGRLEAADDRVTWLGSGAAVLGVHIALLAAMGLATVKNTAPRPEEPVVLVELPPPSAMPPPAVISSPRPAPQQTIVPSQALPTSSSPEPQVEAPAVNAPLPREVVAAAPPTPPQPVRSERPVPAAPVSAPTTAPAEMVPASSAPSTTGGIDPRTRQQEADYYSLVNSHLARNKRYPREARQARQQGVVTVRFTVSRDGAVSNASIRNSSGHQLLDQATLDLLQRVSPLPRFPRSLTRDSVTLTLPIEYSLRTN